MPLRSVYQIDFDQAIAGYEKLIDLAEKHNRIVQQMPVMTGFGAISPRGGGASGNRNMMSDMERATDRLNRAWSKMRDDSRSVVNNVREIVSRFMTLSGLLGGLTGLAGLFGALGFNSMARGAAGGSMTALGAGVPYGGFSMARSGFGLWGNVPGMLTGIANMRQNPSQQLALQMLFGQSGVPGPGADPTQTMMRLMQGAGNLFNKFGPNAGAMWETIPGLSGLVTLEQARMAAGMGQGEIQEWGARARRFGAMGGQPNEQDMRSYRAFVQTLDLSRQTIENTFVRGLSPLAPALEHVTSELTKFITTLLKRPEVGQLIDGLANGIQKWGTEIADFTEKLVKGGYNDQIKEVYNQIKLFGADVATTAGEVAALANALKGPVQGLVDFGKSLDSAYKEVTGFGKRTHDWLFGPSETDEERRNQEMLPGPGDLTPWYDPGTMPNTPPRIPKTGPVFGPQSPIHHSAYQIGGGGDANLPSVRVWPLPLPVTIQWPADEGGGGGQGGGVQNATYNIPSGNGPIPPYSGLGNPTGTGGPTGPPGSHEAFYQHQHDLILAAAVKAGLAHPDVIADLGAAQSAEETGWGKHFVGNNLFGIKAGRGIGQGSVQGYAAFPTPDASAEGYVQFLLKNRRYGGLLQAENLDQALKMLGLSHYAEAPNYTSEVAKILREHMAQMARQQRDPGLHETPAAPAPMSGRPQSGPAQSLQVRVYNETGGNSVMSTAQLAV